MRALHLRFVGAADLPRSLSDFDVEQSFRLSSEDVEAIRKRFAPAFRLGAAVHLTFLRATGRSLDQNSKVPKALLHALSEALGLSATSIATLKTLYSRRATLAAHQLWAKELAGFKDAEPGILAELAKALEVLGRMANSIEDLVEEAELWLFARQQMLPSDRVLRDHARTAFAKVDTAIRAAIDAELTKDRQRAVLKAVFAARRGRTGGTVLEWLKTTAGKHSPTSIAEVTEKIHFLKELGVDNWTLSAISSSRLRGHALSLQHSPPSDLAKLSTETQITQIACFLRVTLLDLTDQLMYMTGRRINDLLRHASIRVTKKQVKSAIEYRKEREEMRSLIYDESKTSDQKIESLKQLLPQEHDRMAEGHSAQVREELTSDSRRLTALLGAFEGLEIKGSPDLDIVKQMHSLDELIKQGATELPDQFDVSVAPPVWRELLQDTDRQKALSALKAATLLEVRRGLRGGRLYLDHSWDFRNREDSLIPPDEWAQDKQDYIRALSLHRDPDKFLERILAHVEVGLEAVSEAVAAGKLAIDDKGLIRLQAFEKLPDEPKAEHVNQMIFKMIGQVQFSDVMIEVDAQTGFGEILLGRKAKTAQELIACYGALLAHGTENDASGVAAMIPGVEVSHITSAMRALEAAGRLREANGRVVEFQRSHPISSIWGSSDMASSDMMALDATRHLYNARVDPRRRTFAVGLYTHVAQNWGVIHDQPIVHNERQSSVAVHGVEVYNSSAEESYRLTKLAVDTHGYTFVGMAVSKLLGFDLCPQMRNLAERRLFLPTSMEIPENLEQIAVTRVSLPAIRKGWDELLRLIASIRSGKVTAKAAMEKLGSAAQGDPMHRAAEQLGKLLRTLFLCDYFTNLEFRREIHTLLNRGESVHLLQRAVYHGRLVAERGRRRDEMRTISGAHALLTNITIAWNTMREQEVIDRLRKGGVEIQDEWIRRIGPVHFSHINFKGLITFGVDAYAEALLQKVSRSRKAG